MQTDETNSALTIRTLQFLDEEINGSLAVLTVLVALLPVDDLRAEHVQIEGFPIVIVVHRLTVRRCACVSMRDGYKCDVDGMSARLRNRLVAKRLYTF